MRFEKITAIAVASILTIGLAAPVFAEDMMLHGDEAIAKRQDLMKLNGKTLKAAGALSGDEAVAGAQLLVDNFTALADLWPEDSQMSVDTEALPNIWTDREGFDAKMADYKAAAEALLAAAQSGDTAAYGAAIKGMGATCGACHGTYRVAQN